MSRGNEKCKGSYNEAQKFPIPFPPVCNVINYRPFGLPHLPRINRGRKKYNLITSCLVSSSEALTNIIKSAPINITSRPMNALCVCALFLVQQCVLITELVVLSSLINTGEGPGNRGSLIKAWVVEVHKRPTDCGPLVCRPDYTRQKPAN